MVTIFREDAWPYLMEKYPRLRDLCFMYGITTAKGAKIFQMEHKNEIDNIKAHELCMLLYTIDFSECFIHSEILSRALESYKVSEYADTGLFLEFLLSDMEDVYTYFKHLCSSRNIDINNASYDTLLDLFKFCIVLKEGHEDLYIKYFNRRLKEDGYTYNKSPVEQEDVKKLSLKPRTSVE